MERCARGGSNDFFWDECKGNSTAQLEAYCQETFHEFNWTAKMWNMQAVPQRYGLSLNDVSNIILTQGALDPWSAEGYQPGSPSVNQDRGIYVLEIPGSAHCSDLRAPNTCDPNTVKNARFQIVQILECWVHGCTTPPRLTSLPQLVIPENTTCYDVNQGYPWGQTNSFV
ncbi:hypothetical protein Y032_0035g3087 [Ancylostoma ceylanicum]|uniref:Peptidase S33 tripeptidyl aminopeptidase-like C-terminal domain-containing protein n=1 Tax=Ancylostoma ceylanicum TaxID=53326 RepID=A0A016ULA8_9BILA|nr:hypothetical protein Y032_0035g3087 [Ancylostoma ceylanicum]